MVRTLVFSLNGGGGREVALADGVYTASISVLVCLRVGYGWYASVSLRRRGLCMVLSDISLDVATSASRRKVLPSLRASSTPLTTSVVLPFGKPGDGPGGGLAWSSVGCARVTVSRDRSSVSARWASTIPLRATLLHVMGDHDESDSCTDVAQAWSRG